MAGGDHPQAILTDAIVTKARRMARAKAHTRGWMRDFAKRYGVTLATLCYAIEGKTWKHVKEPTVKAKQRHAILRGRGKNKRRFCPSCGQPRWYSRLNGCRARFHQIDHRRETSPLNALKAHKANAKRRSA